MENYLSPAAYLSPHPIEPALCSFRWTAGVAIFAKGSLGDAGATLAVCEAFLGMFSEKTEKESTSSTPSLIPPEEPRQSQSFVSFLFRP